MKREFLREFSFLLPVKFAGSCGRCPYKETKGGGFHQTSPFCYAGRRAVFQKGEKILVGVAHTKRQRAEAFIRPRRFVMQGAGRCFKKARRFLWALPTKK